MIAFARREQGLLVAPGNPLKLADIAVGRGSGARAWRCGRRAPARSFCCSRCWRSAGLAARGAQRGQAALPDRPRHRPGGARRRADCGIATRAVALAAGLDFVPLTWERFDLVLRQRDYFLPGPQALFGFMRTAAFRERAAELGGYDVADSGQRPPRQLRPDPLQGRALKKPSRAPP